MVYIGVLVPLSKKTPKISPLLYLQIVQGPLFRPSPPPPMYWFFMTPHPTKNRIFQYTPITLKFFILNIFCHLIFHSDFSLFFR